MAAAASPSSLSTLLLLLFSKWASLEEQSMKIMPLQASKSLENISMSDKY